MKLRYIFPALLAFVMMLTGCSSEYTVDNLKSVQVSSSYVAINKGGGETEITLKAQGDWYIERVDSKDLWFTMSDSIGTAGETTLKFSAPATDNGRSSSVKLYCNGETQYINILQGLASAEGKLATCAEVNSGVEGTIYRIKGTVKSVQEWTKYGNWYIQDETGSTQIYGTTNFKDFDIEPGDEVVVDGPLAFYNGNAELKNATIASVTKSLIKVDSIDNQTLPKEGGVAVVHITCKGQGVSLPEIPEEAKSWLSYSSTRSYEGGATVSFKATPNEGGARSATVTFRTTDGEKEYTSEATINQNGGIVVATLSEFRAAEVGDTQYRFTGIISKLDGKGNFYVTDYSDLTGEVQVYKPTGLPGTAKVGDIVTIVGKRAQYKTTIEFSDVTVEKLQAVEAVSINEFRSKADSNDAYYMISGKISQSTEANTKWDLEKYGNFALTDESGTVYVYGVLAGWGGTKGKLKEQGVTLEDGDNITIIATKSTYKGLIEAVGVFISKNN